MLRFSFAMAVTVTVVAIKLESEKLQSLERVCCGIERNRPEYGAPFTHHVYTVTRCLNHMPKKRS